MIFICWGILIFMSSKFPKQFVATHLLKSDQVILSLETFIPYFSTSRFPSLWGVDWWVKRRVRVRDIRVKEVFNLKILKTICSAKIKAPSVKSLYRNFFIYFRSCTQISGFQKTLKHRQASWHLVTYCKLWKFIISFVLNYADSAILLVGWIGWI